MSKKKQGFASPCLFCNSNYDTVMSTSPGRPLLSQTRSFAERKKAFGGQIRFGVQCVSFFRGPGIFHFFDGDRCLTVFPNCHEGS